MSDLMLKIVGWFMVVLPISAFFYWLFREMGWKGFKEFIVAMTISLIGAFVFFIGMNIISK